MRTPESSPSLPEFLMKARATGIMLGGRVVGSFQYSLTAACVGRLLYASLNGSSSASQFACYWPLVFYRARVYHGNDTLIASKANDGCGRRQVLLVAQWIRILRFAVTVSNCDACCLQQNVSCKCERYGSIPCFLVARSLSVRFVQIWPCSLLIRRGV